MERWWRGRSEVCRRDSGGEASMASDAEGVELSSSEAVSDVAYLPTYLPVKIGFIYSAASTSREQTLGRDAADEE